MDIFDRIEKDHNTIRTLLDQIKDAPEGDRDARKSLYQNLQRELWAHGKVEETVFYAALSGHRSAKSETVEGLNEHQLINSLLDQLNAMPVDGIAWTAKVQVLGEMVKHHLDEEEEELFEEARDVLSDDRARELASIYDDRKTHAMAALAPIDTK